MLNVNRVCLKNCLNHQIKKDDLLKSLKSLLKILTNEKLETESYHKSH